MTMANGQESSLLAAMPPGIGDLTFASEVWVDAAREILTNAATQHADALAVMRLPGCIAGANSPGGRALKALR